MNPRVIYINPARLRNVALAFALLFGGRFAQAQRVETFEKIDGKETPVTDALVTFKRLSDGKSLTTVADENGVAQAPTAEMYEIRLARMGHSTISDTLNAGETKRYYLDGLGVVIESQAITAQYAQGTADASVYKIKVIDRQRIESQAAVNLRDLLMQELNIRVNQDPALGSAMSLQGVSGQNVKILIDGVPVIGRMDGNIDISQINLNNIERVEIVEGPLSVNYGTDALGGVINLITKKNQEKKWEGGVNLYGETIGTYNADGYANASLKKNKVRLNAGRNFFDGWSPVENSRVRQWKPREQYFGGIQYERALGSWKLLFNSNGFYENITNRGEPRISPYQAYAFDEFYKTYRINNAVFLNGVIEKKRYLDFIFSHNYYLRHKNTYRKDLTDLTSEITPNAEQQDTTAFSHWLFRGAYSMDKDAAKFNYQLGYDINIETGEGRRIEDNTQTMGDFAAFASAEYRPHPRLILRPGARYGYNTRYRAPITPSFNIKWDMGARFSLRASYSRGFRAPSLKELYLFFVDASHNIRGNTDLKAEVSNNGTIQLSFKDVKAKRALTAEFNLFYNQITNKIELGMLNAQQNLYSYVNVGEFQSAGGRLSVKYQRARWGAEGGFSYIGRYTNLGDGIATQMLFSPESAVNAYYQFKFGVRVSAFYKFNGKSLGYYLDENETVQQSYISAYHLLDCTVAYTFWKKRLTVSVGAKNLLNVGNLNAQAAGGAHSSGTGSLSIGTGRSAFAGLRANF